MAIGLPLSKFLMSISQFWMGAAWLANGNFTEKWQRLEKNFKLFLPFLGIYLTNFIGIFWSSNLSYAVHDIKVKLPFLLIPFMVSTMPGISISNYYRLLKIFLGSVSLGIVVSLWFYFGFGDKPIQDIREISRFISHIRFSLMVSLGIFICIFLYWKDKENQSWIWIMLATLFTAFLFILHSSTGIGISLIGALFTLLYFLSKNKHSKSLKFIAGLVLFVVGFALWEIITVWKTSFPEPVPIHTQLIKNGRYLYYNDTTYKDRENGNYIWVNVEIVGLKKAWQHRTHPTKEDSAFTNQIFVLVRYLSSLGLPKDSESVMQLSQNQIAEIQSGCTNYKFCNKLDPRYRIYQTLWEIEDYRNQGNADGHSVVMRLEFWKAAWNILKKHSLLGIGTGDVGDELKKSYNEINSQLNPEFRLRAHNQYLTFALAVGLLGLILIFYFIFCWIRNIPSDPNRNYLAWIFIGISLFSMLNEDTLETQAGVSFVAFFATLFFTIQLNPETNPIEEKEA